MSRWSLQLLAAVAIVGSASAEPKTGYVQNGKATTEHPAPSQPLAASISPYLYFNRCLGGCSVKSAGINDARTNDSVIPPGGSYVLKEFTNSFGQNSLASPKGTCIMADWSAVSPATTCNADADCTAAGGAGAICDTADWEWVQLTNCLKEVYSPFAVTVAIDTTTSGRPTGGVSYTMGLIAGSPDDVGLPLTFCGVAPPIPNRCAPQDNVLSFTFANFNCGTNTVRSRIYGTCGVAAQETAHAFGLDHEYTFVDGSHACNDPMSYEDCGEKFFRNEEAMCGANGDGMAPPPRPCLCGGTQNSHAKLLDVFGPGMSTVPAPTATITFPMDGAAVTKSWNTAVSAGSRRGVYAVELWLNGYKWVSKPGSGFSPPDGQQNPSMYSLVAPADVPDGNIKVVAKAFDDLGLEGDAIVTVSKGAACTADADCSAQQAGMKCNTGAATDSVASGGCYWDAPTGALGDKCTYNQFCLTGLCQGGAGDQICTTTCVQGVADSCMAGFECDGASDGKSYCFKTAGDGGGCCSASGAGPVWAHGGLGLLVLGLVMRRRRRCAR
jgi:hypothetical protein